MKKLLTVAAASVAIAAFAADTDCGAIITTGNIADSAKVENLTGANAGKATITINDNSGTAKSVTVYNASTMDTALSGKASTGDLATAEANAQAAANAAYANATNNAAQTYLPAIYGPRKVLDMGYGNSIDFTGDTTTDEIRLSAGSSVTSYKSNGTIVRSIIGPSTSTSYTFTIPTATGTAALVSDISASTNALWEAIPSWALAALKPSYNFSEIGSKPTTLSGYGITDAKIANGTITLGSNTITPLTSYTETDPVWTAAKGSYSTTAQMNTAITAATNGLAKASALSGYVPTSRKVAGKTLTTDVTLSNLSIVGSTTTTYNGSATASVNQTTLTETAKTSGGTTGKTLTLAVASTSRTLGEYYVAIGSDGRPHLMLRN